VTLFQIRNLSAIFIITNRVIGLFGFFILPIIFARHLLICPQCDRSYVLYKIPIFSALLEQHILSESEVCMLELICALSLFFRVLYVRAAHNAILDAHMIRFKRKGLRPKRALTKLIIIGCVIFIVFLIGLLFPLGEIKSYEARKAIITFISGTFLFCYVIPEALLYVWLIFSGKIDSGEDHAS